MKNNLFEIVDYQCKTLAYVIEHAPLPDQTTFLTPDECNQQVGYVVHKAGYEIPRHMHNPLKREIVGTTEVLLIMKGRCRIEFYDDNKVLIGNRELKEGDLIIIVAGGHSFHMLEDTVMLEIKQGPYPGLIEKERF